MPDSKLLIQRALEADALRAPVMNAAIQTLQLPTGSHGLDVGCGIGLQALALANAVGGAGRVTGLDIDPALLVYGADLARQAGMSRQVEFHQGDIRRLPFEDDCFDWAWSADCIGYPAGELLPLLAELARVVRPGGSVILLGWTSQQLLPGYSLLEARLNATCSAYAPFLNGKSPETNFSRALRWFRQTGFVNVRAQTLVGDVQAPLSAVQRTALTALFKMLWGEHPPGVRAQDWTEFQNLCQPEAPDFILNLPEYYAFFTYSLFRGQVPIDPNNVDQPKSLFSQG